MLTSDERGQVDAITRRLRQRQAAIAADPGLSPQGRREVWKREQQAAALAHRQILAAADARHEAAVRAAHSRAFGRDALAGTDVLAAREAALFAETVDDPRVALKHFSAADRRGDASLCTALAERAWRMSGTTDANGAWGAVLSAYADSSPERNAALGSFAELARPAQQDQLRENFYRHPPDLRGVSPEATASQPAPTMNGA